MAERSVAGSRRCRRPSRPTARATHPFRLTKSWPRFDLADSRLTIELVAADPQLDSPVAICWDADGRLFVAEMIDYPLGPTAGRIRLLEDRDGDGRYEQATVFADGLQFPNGVLAARGGLFVTAAPDLLFLQGYRRRRPGRRQARRVHRLWRRQSATARQRSDLGTRQLDLRRQRPQRRQHPPAQRSARQGRFDSRPRFSLPPRRQRLRGHQRPKPVRPDRATTGAIAFCRGTRFRSATRCSISRSWIAIRGSARMACATSPIPPTLAPCFPSAPARRPSIASGPTITTRCAG